jgi:hypothetical protein
MGFFGSGDKNTSTYASQTGVSDDGTLLEAGAAQGQEQSINVGGGGVLNTTKIGSTEIGTLATNSLLNSTNTGTINYGFGATDVSSLLADTTSGIAGLVKQQSDAAQKSVADVVTGLQDLALSKQTGGESARDNTILWVVGLSLAGLAALAAIFLGGGKRG